MRSRRTARVLLFDPAGRLLLVRMHDPHVGGADGAVVQRAYWVTIGGEIDPGEEIEAAARREIAEETGQTRALIGSPVWYVEHVLTVKGEPRLFQETFLVAHTEETGWSSAGWTADEHGVIKSLKWWEPAELFASGELFFPTSLKENLPEIAAGRYPPAVIRIEP